MKDSQVIFIGLIWFGGLSFFIESKIRFIGIMLIYLVMLILLIYQVRKEKEIGKNG